MPEAGRYLELHRTPKVSKAIVNYCSEKSRVETTTNQKEDIKRQQSNLLLQGEGVTDQQKKTSKLLIKPSSARYGA